MLGFNKIILLFSFLTFSVVEAFAPTPTTSHGLSNSQLHSTDDNTETDNDNILKPKYEIESIPIRIGHGFDIHRMAPIGDAGQPVIIGGVEITHKDQKVKKETHQLHHKYSFMELMILLACAHDVMI